MVTRHFVELLQALFTISTGYNAELQLDSVATAQLAYPKPIAAKKLVKSPKLKSSKPNAIGLIRALVKKR